MLKKDQSENLHIVEHMHAHRAYNLRVVKW